MISAVATQLWSEWKFRAFVMVSLAANVGVGLLSRTRRRSASGWWAYVRVVGVSLLWFLYQVAEKASMGAISKLTLNGSDVSDDEKQLLALWVSFLLLHLGGPDNLTAYALEDNKLSKRTLLKVISNVLWVGYDIYNYTHGGGHSRVLLVASILICVSGTTRYFEKAYALGKSNLDKMQEDASSASPGCSKKETEECYRCRSTEDKMDQLRYRIKKKQEVVVLCDRDALLLAQDLFPVWRHAMVDSSVIPGSSTQQASEQILRLECRSMCKVAEMELSLMYEVLYTKAILAHTCPGCYYLIRFLSPLFTAAAVLLFCLHLQQQGGHRIRGSFVGITYALLVVNFLLDLAWLLRALGSTWTYAYLQTQAPAWLQHQVICPGRWCRLHRFIVCIDPMSWLLCRDPVSYRTWSGTIGRYNFLREAITPTTRCPEWLDPNKEIPYLSKLPRDVKELLLQRVQKIFQDAVYYPKDDKDYAKKRYIMEDIRSKWGEKAFDLKNLDHNNHHKRQLFPGLVNIHADEEAPRFGKEFEEDVLAWHIATGILLPYVRQLGVPAGSKGHAEAIEVMSEYMMFLVAVRRDMLPGLVLHSLLEVTKNTLAEIWRTYSYKENLAEVSNEDKLAKILRLTRVATPKKEGKEMKASEGTTFVLDAVNLFASLTLAGDTEDDRKIRKRSFQPGQTRVKRRTPVPVPELLELIFNIWVDKLVYAALRCSRESHAKQLSAGGDLATVLWMIIQHAGPFRMGELKAIYIPTSAPARPSPSHKEKTEPPEYPPPGWHHMEPSHPHPQPLPPHPQPVAACPPGPPWPHWRPQHEQPMQPMSPPPQPARPPYYCPPRRQPMEPSPTEPAWPPGPPCYDPTTTMAPTCPGFGGAPPQPPCYGWPPATTIPICPCCGGALPQPPCCGPNTTMAPTCPGCGGDWTQPPCYGPTTTTSPTSLPPDQAKEDEDKAEDYDDEDTKESPTSLPPDDEAKEDEDKAEDYDDEDTKEYNTPIKYATL